MRRGHERSLLLLSLVIVLANLSVVVFPVEVIALGGICDATTPCERGDIVLGDKQLSAADPITSSMCAGDGLVLPREHFRLTLDFNGHTIRGDGVGTGVDALFLSGVEIRGGTISGFRVGISAGELTQSHIAGMRLIDNGIGLFLIFHSRNNLIENVLIEGGGLAADIEGSENTLRSMTIRDTEGIVARGGFERHPRDVRPGNVLLSNRIEDTRGDGLVVIGSRNTVARNVVVGSAGDGIAIENNFLGSADNTVNNNLVSFSGGHGLRFAGTGDTVFRNVAKNNGGNGLHVEATASTLDRNQSFNNGGFGIEDGTAGDGTAGTANTYTSNICYTANSLGKSSPAGLCR